MAQSSDTRRFLLHAMLVALCAQPVRAAPPKPTPEPQGPSLCPEAIKVEQRIADLPPEWEAGLSDSNPGLLMVTFFDGPPAGRASLKYDSELKLKGNWIATWTLAPNARGYWIQCGKSVQRYLRAQHDRREGPAVGEERELLGYFAEEATRKKVTKRTAKLVTSEGE